MIICIFRCLMSHPFFAIIRLTQLLFFLSFVFFFFFVLAGGGWYSSNAILVNEAIVQNEDTIVIKCGSEIVPGPDREG